MTYEVIRSRRRTMTAEIKGDRLIIRAPAWATEAEIRSFLQKNRKWIEEHMARAQYRQQQLAGVHRLTGEEKQALAERARAVIPARVAYYAPRIGVTYGRITLRWQATRWGSCSSKGNLNFNCLLMLAPPAVLDSVVVHELCHRKEMNHSPRFYAEVLRVFPEYWEAHRWLKENGPALLAMLREP